MLILLAGHETTTNMIGLSVLNLLKNPEELRKLRENPALIDGAVDELMRYDSSVQALARVCREDIELHGKSLKKGDTLMLSLASANRDPEWMADADRLDISRPSVPSLTFGHGPHFCLGASLTKLEMKIALTALLSRFPHLRLAEEQELQWIPALSHRGLRRLDLVTGASALF
jgi:cytochrome P450